MHRRDGGSCCPICVSIPSPPPPQHPGVAPTPFPQRGRHLFMAEAVGVYLAIRDRQNQTMFPRELLWARMLAGGSVVLMGQRVGHHTNHLLPGGLAGGGEVLAVVGGQDDDEDVTQELSLEGGEGVSPVLPPTSLPTIAPFRCSCVDTGYWGIHHKARNGFVTTPRRAPGSLHSLHLWHSPGCLDMLDPPPQTPPFACCAASSLCFDWVYPFPSHPSLPLLSLGSDSLLLLKWLCLFSLLV